jgi:hypothetical protein
MQLSTLRTLTQEFAGMSASDTLNTPTILTDVVNHANLFIGAEHDWPWQEVHNTTFSTVVGQQDYLPAVFAPAGDWLRTKEVRSVAPGSIASDGFERFDITELDDRWPTTVQARPQEYAIWGGNLRLAPIPDAVYTIRHEYIKMEPYLVNDTDVPLMPVQFHSAIAHLAAVYLLKRSRAEERAERQFEDYQQWRLLMLNDRKRATSPNRVRVRPGGWL